MKYPHYGRGLTCQEGAHSQQVRPYIPQQQNPPQCHPPEPRLCFSPDALIEDIAGLAETREFFALIDLVGAGKAPIALTALYHDRIKEQFVDNR